MLLAGSFFCETKRLSKKSYALCHPMFAKQIFYNDNKPISTPINLTMFIIEVV